MRVFGQVRKLEKRNSVLILQYQLKSLNPDKPKIPNHKYQVPKKSQCSKLKIPNTDMALKKEQSNSL